MNAIPVVAYQRDLLGASLIKIRSKAPATETGHREKRGVELLAPV